MDNLSLSLLTVINPGAFPTLWTIKTEASLRPIKGGLGLLSAKWLQQDGVKRRILVTPRALCPAALPSPAQQRGPCRESPAFPR